MNPHVSSMRAQVIALSFLLTASASLALMSSPVSEEGPEVTTRVAVATKGTAPEGPATAAPPAPAKAAAGPAPASAQVPASPPQGPNLDAYRGMGAWVDMYDFGRPNTLPPQVIVEELALRGVKTLFLQTGRWNLPQDMLDPAALATFIDSAHAKKIKVVAWYLPGFADNDMEMRRSLAAINFTTPAGQKFDGFAPDIEDARAVGKDMIRFNGGIVDYSKRLRAAVGPDYALGAIVVDAKNNKRAPGHWAAFPWPEIGQVYDVILPMAYWSVTKKQCGEEMDAVGYMREVIAETERRMDVHRPFHLIGGIADCTTPSELTGFVDASFELGTIGGSIYDFWTTHPNPAKEHFWAQLGRFNQMLSPPARKA